jgi:starch-binding outer membrane protein, SusD/RagB family
MRRYFVILYSLAGLTACGALDVNNPTQITIETVENSVGANYAVTGARNAFSDALSAAVLNTGALTDEFFPDVGPNTGHVTFALDRRDNQAYLRSILGNENGLYAFWQTTWVRASFAMALVHAYGQPTLKDTQLAELFAIRGYTMLSMAEQICPGFPVRELDLSNLKEIVPKFTGHPLSTNDAFTRAIVEFDSAIAYAGDSVRFLNLARTGKARALLGLGQFDAAATTAAGVESDYIGSYQSRYLLFTSFNFERWSVADREATTGLDFVSAADPRISLRQLQHATSGDTTTMLYCPTLYCDLFPPIVVASGIEATLIRAEAELHADPEGGSWLTRLNDLRATVGLAETSDPGTANGRIDLLFRERAFWLFGTAHRLGDFRRLMDRYVPARSPETLFAVGANRVGDTYGTLTNIPFDGEIEHRHNAEITGCTDQ